MRPVAAQAVPFFHPDMAVSVGFYDALMAEQAELYRLVGKVKIKSGPMRVMAHRAFAVSGGQVALRICGDLSFHLFMAAETDFFDRRRRDRLKLACVRLVAYITSLLPERFMSLLRGDIRKHPGVTAAAQLFIGLPEKPVVG